MQYGREVPSIQYIAADFYTAKKQIQKPEMNTMCYSDIAKSPNERKDL